MREMTNMIKITFAALGGFLGWFLGGCDSMFYALVAFVAADYLTGVMCAIADKKLSSDVGFKGIFKKVCIFMLVGIGHTLDTHVIGNSSIMRTTIIFFYLANEGISLIENVSRLELPIPKKLKEVLEQLKDGDNK